MEHIQCYRDEILCFYIFEANILYKNESLIYIHTDMHKAGQAQRKKSFSYVYISKENYEEQETT